MPSLPPSSPPIGSECSENRPIIRADPTPSCCVVHHAPGDPCVLTLINDLRNSCLDDDDEDDYANDDLYEDPALSGAPAPFAGEVNEA